MVKCYNQGVPKLLLMKSSKDFFENEKIIFCYFLGDILNTMVFIILKIIF